MLEQTSDVFPATRWTLIAAVQDGDPKRREDAFRVLAQTYWPAIYAFIRRFGLSTDDAADLTQSFFSNVLMDRGLLDKANRERGSLRALLRTAIGNHLKDHERRTHVDRRLIELYAADLIREDAAANDQNENSPEEEFNRRWAMAVLQQAMTRCQAFCEASGKAAMWKAFEERVVTPSLLMSQPPLHEDIALRIGMSDATDSIEAVRSIRRRLPRVIREVIDETIVDPRDREQEYRDIMYVLTST